MKHHRKKSSSMLNNYLFVIVLLIKMCMYINFIVKRRLNDQWRKEREDLNKTLSRFEQDLQTEKGNYHYCS